MAEGFKVADAFVDIHAKTDGIGRDVESGINRNVDGNRLGSGIGSKLMLGIGAAIAAGGALIAIPLLGAINAAGDLAEAQNKVNVVYGNSSSVIDKFAANSATAYGLSKQQVYDFTGALGNMYTQLGFNQGQAADMSGTMLQLAADTASFNNVPVAEVQDAIGAAYRGEYDSLQKYIPTISAAAVEQRAMADSGKTNASQLSATDKALALNALMTEGSANATGDFARTQDGLANQQKTLQASVADLGASFGEALLPALTEIVTFLNGSVVPALTSFVGWIKENPGVMTAMAVAIGIVTVAVLALAAALWVASLTPITLIIAAIIVGIVLFIGVLVLLITQWENIWLGLQLYWLAFQAWITGVFEGFIGWWNGIWTAVAEWATSVWNGFINFITSVWSGFVGWLTGIVNGIASWWNGIWSAIGSFVQGIWQGIVSFVMGAAIGLYTAVSSAINNVRSIWNSVWQGIASFLSGIWSGITSSVSTAINTVVTTITGIQSRVMGALSGAASWLVSTGSNIISGLVNGISGAMGRVVSVITGGVQGAINSVKNLLGIHSPSRLFRDEIGKMIPAGIEVGVKAGQNSLQDTLDSMVDVPEMAMSNSLPIGAVAGNTTINQTNHVTIDARNIKDFNDVLAVFNNLQQAARGGRGSFGGLRA